MLPLLAMLILPSARAAALAGVDLVPFGRGDLAWIEGGQLSGTQVSETDGWLSPPLTAWGGFVKGRNAWTFGLAVARATTTTWVASSGKTDKSVVHTGALRPSFEYRRYLVERTSAHPTAWAAAGAWGVLPSARRSSDLFTADEQSAADDVARQDRSRIGAAGLRLGLGAELLWDDGFALGARTDVGAQATRVLEDDATTLGVLLSSETALTMSFTFR